ncbi:MAG TPA: hypothetical protein VG317_20600 [Pseudonocardiaceae bacterium]|jgi:hypothetical protein|nr:hypothetical protein [Pseudonocardiaceae bacterium]
MASGRDIGELVDLAPADVTSYLRSTGWQDAGDYGRAIAFTRPVAGEDVEVLLPRLRELRDYPARMNELLDTVSIVEGRSAGDVLRDLRSPLLDVQHIRTMPSTPSGTTPVEDGFRAVRGVRALYLEAVASALAARDDTGRDETQASPADKARPKKFLDQVRLGAATAGSYVLRVETEVEPDHAPVSEDIGIGARAVLSHLHRVTIAAHSASAESARAGTPRPFEGYVGQDVSAKLCGALADLGGVGQNPFEISFTWAWALPAVDADDLPAELRFDGPQVHALRAAAKHLSSLSEPRPATVEGRASQLNQDDPHAPGRVIIDGRLITEDGVVEDQKVVARLPVADYGRIVEAHHPARPARVKVFGTVRAAGRRWEFTEVTGIEIVD